MWKGGAGLKVWGQWEGIVNIGFQEEFSNLKKIKGKRMHRYELHVCVLA